MLFEKFIVRPDVFQLIPALYVNGLLVQIIDFGPFHGQQEGGVSGDDELTAVEAHGLLEKFQKLLLLFGRKAVFRLVQQIQAVVLYFFFKVQKGAFSVGMLPDIIHQTFPDEFGLGIASRQIHFFQTLIIVQGAHLKMGIFRVQVIVEQRFPLPVDGAVLPADRKPGD